jgi:hypothetical protein
MVMEAAADGPSSRASLSVNTKALISPIQVLPGKREHSEEGYEWGASSIGSGTGAPGVNPFSALSFRLAAPISTKLKGIYEWPIRDVFSVSKKVSTGVRLFAQNRPKIV